MKIENLVRISGALVLIAAATLATASSAAPPGGTVQADQPRKLAPSSRATVGRSPGSRLARTDPALLGRDDTEIIPVLVKLDHDAVASYQGGVSGYGATSPAVTGHRLAGDAAERAYEDYLAEREQRFTGALAKALPDAQVRQRLRTVYGGVGITVPANQVKKLLTIDGVVAVQRDELRQRLTDSSSGFIGADAVRWRADGSASTQQNAGQGVIVGCMSSYDSGVRCSALVVVLGLDRWTCLAIGHSRCSGPPVCQATPMI